MPSAVAEAEAAARYVADVWRLNTASRLHWSTLGANGSVAKVSDKHCVYGNGQADSHLYAAPRRLTLPMPKGRGFLDTNDTCLLK